MPDRKNDGLSMQACGVENAVPNLWRVKDDPYRPLYSATAIKSEISLSVIET